MIRQVTSGFLISRMSSRWNIDLQYGTFFILPAKRDLNGQAMLCCWHQTRDAW